MYTISIKNVSGKHAFFSYGDAGFYLDNGATQTGLSYDLAKSRQLQLDLAAGLIEVALPTITIKNTSGKDVYMGYGEPAFSLAAGASKSSDDGRALLYNLACNPLFQSDVAAGLIEITAGSPVVAFTNLTALSQFFAYNQVAEYLAPSAGTLGDYTLDSGVPGVQGLQDNAQFKADIAAAVIDVDATITISAGAHGSCTPTGVQTVVEGSDLSVVITPATGYHIAAVLIDAGPSHIDAPAESPYVFTHIVKNHTLAATFAINVYDVVFDLDGGTRTGGGTLEQEVNYGANATAPEFTDPNHKKFNSWSETITNVTEDLAVVALYDDAWNLAYTAGANGSIVGTATQIVVDGEDGTEVVATPASHYHFVEWSDDAEAPAARTDLAVAADITAEASFAHDTAVLTMAVVGDGTVTPAVGDSTVDTYTAFPIEAVNGAGTFDHWTPTGLAFITDANAASTTATLTGAGTVTATFV